MRIPNRCLLALALLASVTGASTLAARPAAAQVLIRPDAALRAAMSTRLKAGAAAHHVVPDMDTLALASSPAGLLAGAAIPPSDGLRGIVDGDPFALVTLEGPRLKIPRGTYRIELGSFGEALLLRSNGTTVAHGTTAINIVANPGTGYCEWEDPDDDDHECLTCNYGIPGGPGGSWSVSTCIAIYNPAN